MVVWKRQHGDFEVRCSLTLGSGYLSAFEFFFSFYGLILGLSVAEVITGLIRVLKQRQRVRIGWLTPLLGLFVLLDVASFWSGAWQTMQSLEVSYGLLVVGLGIAGLYFAAASTITPADTGEWPDFDEYFDKHKAFVATCILATNALANVGVPLLIDASDAIRKLQDPAVWILVGPYYALLICLVLFRNRRVSGVLLVLLIAIYGVFAVGVPTT